MSLHPMTEFPRLRPLQLFADETAQVIIAYDPQGFTEPIGLDIRLAPLLLLCDGQHSLSELPALLLHRFGQRWSADDLADIIHRLDEWLLLDSPRFATLAARQMVEFRAATVRPAAHAGVSYPDEPEALRQRLDAILAHTPDCPLGAARLEQLVGVVAPHIDLRVGERAYAPAYRLIERLAATLPDGEPVTFVVLGTSHYGGDGLFVASRKDYATPLGALPCDREFLDRLEIRLGASISADDTPHRQEHAIEFQAVFLRHIFDRHLEAGRPVRMVPILCTSLHELYAADEACRERTQAEYRAFIEALQATLAEQTHRTLLLVGGDLAHVGPKFGDRFDAQTRAAELERADTELLDYVATGDSAAVLDHIARDEDVRRVCGFPPLMAYLDALAAFGPTEGQVLHYEQWQERPTRSAVTYGAAAAWRSV
ncbi:AmmeMemoRadiSam system protein B [Chloracidobacterium aggregatum]|jgi:AmmeMemoRadiSam system protein B|uniref:AmmeMemoRadiSam system protein B n=2 Tax=Chloracidobacterium TaxID=458032 RepID=A0ABX8AY09_9BACT|nr:AmmeMemoRadiSam system protein B [Chloracidobacterium aggregatum]QUV84034.1 AmmeMemoRadiSam system protein B [Chloracidobacterium sp. 2]QUV93593.1 AmmeMemoRadiSam system protein B [Chloracidobacterium sp. N]